MSVPASETNVDSSSLQAESSCTASVDAAAAAVIANQEADAAPRRGLRARKPTAKAAGLDVTETVEQQPSRTTRKRKADDVDAEKEPSASTQTEADADRINDEVNEVFDGAEGDGEEDDDKQYCICRGKDDGTFMISCERCQEWYHTKCIGITQKAAKKLDEYVCEACTNADKARNTGKASTSKATKKYKSTKRRKTVTQEQRQETASEHEDEAEEDDENDASDGDEYVGERGDDASEPEEAAMQDEDESAPTTSARSQRQAQSKASASRTYSGISKSKTDTSDKQSTSKASESARRPSASNKPGPGPNKGSPRKPTGPSDASTEEARSRARKVLSSALEKIFSTHPAEPSSEDEEPKTDAERAEAYAALLESELFETNADFHGSSSVRVVGAKYKDRFRTFLFSLKDAKNTTLHSRIASGDLKPSELAKMSNQELANDAIRQATEKARLEALQRSTLRSEEAGPMRKITHKGEIEIESDTQTQQQGQREERVKPPAARVSESEPVKPRADDRGEEKMETEEKSGLQAEMERRSAPAPTRIEDSPTRLNFGDVWAKDADCKGQEGEAEPQESYGFDVGSPAAGEAYNHGITEDGEGGAADGADDFIDSFLDSNGQDAAATAAEADAGKSSEAQQRSTTPEAEPPSTAVHRYRSVIWNGLIDLPDVFAFQGHVKQIAGRSLTSAPRVWPKFYPDRPLLIAGRLPTKVAADYLLQVVNASRTEILAFTMEPGVSKDGVAQPSDSDKASFDGMLKHFKDADRWGALHISSSVKGSLIKDFYVVPLRRDEEVPLWLDLAESDCLGAEWHAKRDRDLLVLVAVVIKDALQTELARAERGVARQRSVTNEAEGATPGSGADGAYDPTAGISVAFSSANTAAPVPAPAASFGGDALQSLLRTLGKTAPPAAVPVPGAGPPGPPPPGPPPGPPPSFVSPPLGGAGSPLAMHGAVGGGATPPQPWQPHQAYAAQPYDYSGGGGQGGGWEGEAPQEMPEEEYPGQYNPDFLAQTSSGHAGYGGRVRGQGHGHVYAQGRGRGAWRGRGW